MSVSSIHITELETPAAVVDLDKLSRNLDRAASYAKAHSLALRPHVKTHKSAWIAAEQMERGAVGVTCATPREAEVMSGVADDILLAYPPVGAKARRVAQLARGDKITVALDSLEAIDAIENAARATKTQVGVYVELDLGMHRVGVPAVEAAIGLAKRIQRSDSLSYEGLAFYPGHIREPVGTQTKSLDQLADALRSALDMMIAAGVPPRIVSGGSTPTLWHTHEIPGVTEIRPGTYVFNDRTTAEIGACAWDDCALTVAATVVSTAVPGQAVIDAGTKALGREPLRGADAAGGFGALLERPDVTVKGMSEEHGLLDLSRTDWRPRVGDVVRVVPNHVCIVVHLNDLMYGVLDDRVVRSWPVEARGRGQPLTPNAD
jgi:D-serine deaminase-like pyridoxal phosphate-dependent protein